LTIQESQQLSNQWVLNQTPINPHNFVNFPSTSHLTCHYDVFLLEFERGNISPISYGCGRPEQWKNAATNTIQLFVLGVAGDRSIGAFCIDLLPSTASIYSHEILAISAVRWILRKGVVLKLKSADEDNL
jgi:hypothetical protein